MCSSPSTAPPSTSSSGPVSVVATKAGQHLAPLAATLRSSVPATAPALDAAASTLSRGSATADAHLATLQTELETPEAVELRKTASSFLAALGALVLRYLSRLLGFAERRLEVSPPNPDDGHAVRARRVAGAGATLAARRGALAVRAAAGDEREDRPFAKKMLKIVAEGVVGGAGLLGGAAAKGTQYRGQGDVYVGMISRWVAQGCEIVVGEEHVSSSGGEAAPVGESFGTLPFTPVQSEGSDISNLSKEGKAD